MPSPELVARGQHVMTVCNACRYCEAYCPVFQAMENRLTFSKTDLTYLAALCHNCGECLYACQYAPPHEFGINVPRTLSEIRVASYEERAWPPFLAWGFRVPHVAMLAALAIGLVAILPLARMLYGQTVFAGDFYDVIPHAVMVALFSTLALLVILAFIAATVRLKPDTTGVARPEPFDSSLILSSSKDELLAQDVPVEGRAIGTGFSRTIRGLRDAMTLRHLHPSGVDCAGAEESRSPWRRWFHHCTSYGFALCFASTTVAAVYHLVFDWRAPYAYTSLPVVLGTAGGIGLLVGPTGLLALARARDAALDDRRERELGTPFLVLLFMTSLTGLLLLVLRKGAAMPALLVVHLAFVVALFLTLPFGKFVHAIYRVAALVKFAREDARLLLFVAVAIGASATAGAHEIPNDVTIQAWLKPEGSRLRLVVRVPLTAMRDVNYPRRGRDFVDLARVDQLLRDAATVWIGNELQLFENGAPLPPPSLVDVRASLASDPSFHSAETALAHVTGPRLPDSSDFVWNQGLLDALFEYPIQSDRSRFAIEPHWARLGVRSLTVFRFVPPDGGIRAFEFAGDPGRVELDPRWHQAALQFVRLGFFHILDGTDHLLFLLCLVIPFRRLRSLVIVVTSFTVAHSITLIASAYDLAPGARWFPPLIETLIAMSIVFMALENIVSPNLGRRWLITFAFGLVHGFGFSFALRETLQFAGSHLLTSLVSFNIGVELGQLLVLAALVPALDLLFRFVVAERAGTILLSAILAHTGWHWMIDRAERLREVRVEARWIDNRVGTLPADGFPAPSKD